MATKDKALKMRKEQDEYWSKIIKQAEEALKPVEVIASGTVTWGEWKKPSWQELSDDEINQACLDLFDTSAMQGDLDFARAIEQTLKEKNYVSNT